jgi:hypothetical protein
VNLPGAMSTDVFAQLLHQCQRIIISRMAHDSTKTSRLDRNVVELTQGASQQTLSHRAATDIANANYKNVLNHLSQVD